jgi:L-fuconolactonase
VEIIDSHPHVIGADRATYPFAPLGGKLAPWADPGLPAEQLLDEMDDAGVARAVLVQASTVYGYDNRYVADSVQAHPERFAGVCCIDVRAPDAAARLRHWIDDRRLAGMRIFTSGSAGADDSDWISDPATFPAWETAAELGIPVCLQMKASAFPRLDGLLRRFPGVAVVLDHCSHVPTDDGPPYERAAAFFELARHGAVYLKLTEHNFREFAGGAGTVESFLRRTIEAFGADHLMWGSNYPASKGPLKELVALAQRELAFLSESERRWILHGTAATLYPPIVHSDPRTTNR